jgi:hypothetical protein
VIALEKKLSYFGILLLMAVLVVSSFSIIDVVSADGPIVTIFSPLNDSTVESQSVRVSFKVELPPNSCYLNDLTEVICYLDGQLCDKPSISIDRSSWTSGSGELNLTGLSEGKHTLIINGSATINAPPIAMYAPWAINPVNVTFYVIEPTQQPTQTNQTTQQSGNPFSSMAMVLSGVIAGVVIVSIALLIIYRKQNLKRKDDTNNP